MRPTMLADLRVTLVLITRVLRENDDHHHGAWRSSSAAVPVGYARWRLDAYAAGNATEAHLGHAACRPLFAFTRKLERAQ